jgi:hypothetical protein
MTRIIDGDVSVERQGGGDLRIEITAKTGERIAIDLNAAQAARFASALAALRKSK